MGPSKRKLMGLMQRRSEGQVRRQHNMKDLAAPFASPFGDQFASPFGDPFASPFGDPFAAPTVSNDDYDVMLEVYLKARRRRRRIVVIAVMIGMYYYFSNSLAHPEDVDGQDEIEEEDAQWYLDQLDGMAVDGSSLCIPRQGLGPEDAEGDEDDEDANGDRFENSPMSPNSRKRASSTTDTATSPLKKINSPMVGLMRELINELAIDRKENQKVLQQSTEEQAL